MQKIKAVIMDEKAMSRASARISYEILEQNHGIEDVCLIGIKRRGAVVAERIAGKIKEIEKREVPLGFLDITPYRDDVDRKEPSAEKSNIPFDVTGKRVVLVDDVLYTGRSVRAAIDAIMDRGRPDRLQLAVLIDRGHRELPISPDFVGKNAPTSRNEDVHVHVTEFDGENCVVISENGEKA